MIKKKNILIIVLNLILILFLISTTVYGDLISKFDSSISTTSDSANEVATKSGKVVGTIQIVGTIAAFGIMVVIGIKYVLGSAEEKAEYKKTLVPYFIGAVLIFGFSNLTKLIFDWAQEI